MPTLCPLILGKFECPIKLGEGCNWGSPGGPGCSPAAECGGQRGGTLGQQRNSGRHGGGEGGMFVLGGWGLWMGGLGVFFSFPVLLFM